VVAAQEVIVRGVVIGQKKKSAKFDTDDRRNDKVPSFYVGWGGGRECDAKAQSPRRFATAARGERWKNFKKA